MSEGLPAHITLEGLFPGVNSLMFSKLCFPEEGFPTISTFMMFPSRINALVCTIGIGIIFMNFLMLIK